MLFVYVFLVLFGLAEANIFYLRYLRKSKKASSVTLISEPSIELSNTDLKQIDLVLLKFR